MYPVGRELTPLNSAPLPIPSHSYSNVKVLVLQIKSSDSIEGIVNTENEQTGRTPDFLILPEYFIQTSGEAEISKNSELLRLSKIAKDNSMIIIAGSMLERSGSKVYNTSVIIDENGEVSLFWFW